MSVKFTRRLGRAQAEEHYCNLHVELQSDRRRQKLTERTAGLTSLWVYTANRHSGHLQDLPTEAMVEAYILVDRAVREARWRTEAQHEVIDMSDDMLETELERMHDEHRDGEGYESYVIVPHPVD